MVLRTILVTYSASSSNRGHQKWNSRGYLDISRSRAFRECASIDTQECRI